MRDHLHRAEAIVLGCLLAASTIAMIWGWFS